MEKLSTDQKGESVGITIRVPHEMKEKLEEWRLGTGLATSDICRRLIDEGIDTLNEAKEGKDNKPLQGRLAGILKRYDITKVQERGNNELRIPSLEDLSPRTRNQIIAILQDAAEEANEQKRADQSRANSVASDPQPVSA